MTKQIEKVVEATVVNAMIEAGAQPFGIESSVDENNYVNVSVKLFAINRAIQLVVSEPVDEIEFLISRNSMHKVAEVVEEAYEIHKSRKLSLMLKTIKVNSPSLDIGVNEAA